MRILVIIERSPLKRYLVELESTALIGHLMELLGQSAYGQAAILAITKGRIEQEICESDIPTLKADLILSEKNARWNIAS